jgi:cytidylate kinase
MFRIITVEREYGCGAGCIAAELAGRIGWKLWDNLLTDEVARLGNVQPSDVMRCEGRMDSTFHRLAKTFLRGSYERSSPLGKEIFDADRLVALMEQICPKIAHEGNAVVVGRGAPYFLREQPDAFHVFLYAPRAEKVRRLIEDGASRSDAEDLVDTVDRERIAFIKHYFDADWPTRSLYHVMINTAIGNQSVIETILHTMRLVEGHPKATDFERPKVPTTI